ncbi:uncharacterized protein BDV14DRAFT_204372 [Aspergillus stella-maris]|uniref:uncharacterized protein n=1 Tax=Aspergillus stella-maris TaxID=1810926 RepID=UPI003CCD3170
MRLTNALLPSISAAAAAVSAHTVSCFRREDTCLDEFIAEGINWLRAGKETDLAHLDPDMCWRVSCSWGTGISWCNTDKEHDKFMSFFHIAEGAQVIRDECGYYGGATSGGIVDHPDKWQVIVHKDDC